MNLNLTRPEIPFDIFSLALDDADLTYDMRCDELWSEVIEEVRCETYMHRIHHNVGTYDQGCRGPLCRKAQREHPKRRSAATLIEQSEERIYDPVLEFFHTIIKHRIRAAQQHLLKELKEQTA